MSDQSDWLAVNDKHLAATVAWIRMRLRHLVENADAAKPAKKCAWFERSGARANERGKSYFDTEAIEEARQEMVKLEAGTPPPALNLLAKYLGLSTFDRQVLALCAAMELDTCVAGHCANAQGDVTKRYPTFALAFALFDDPDWNALSPHGPLRYWRLLEINQPCAQPLTGAALVLDERILNYLKGSNYLDDRLTLLFDPIGVASGTEALPESQQRTVDRLIESITHSNGPERAPVIELLGHDAAGKRLIADRVASGLGLNLQITDLRSLPVQTGEFETFTRLWQRESLLMPLALYIDTNGASDAEKTLLKRFLERSGGLVFVDLEEARIDTVRHRVAIEVGKPTPEEQQQLWLEALSDQAGDQPQRLAEQFSFSQNEIARLAKSALATASTDSQVPAEDLWQRCRAAARIGMEQLAQRIDAKAVWDELVLPPDLKTLLRQITEQVARRSRVYDDWGFRRKMNRGLGISALFAGESGTGKTMAAEVIANDLQLDLYRIDLSAVVSKYIGETEKNLRKLFDAAEDSGAILFFDEADALFGKRSEVKDSHDRYANIEINYLLQRMEAYRGLAILATNMKNAVDKAFVRRLRFIVDFPFPGVAEREEIWHKVFPEATPVDPALDYQRLSKLNLTGGSIHNVALNAAFLAAQQQDGRVTMPMVLNAARTEFKKLDRPAKESDFKWQGPTEMAG